MVIGIREIWRQYDDDCSGRRWILFKVAWRNETTCGLCCLPSISVCFVEDPCTQVTSASRHLAVCPSSLSSSIQRPYTHRLDFSLLFDVRRPLLSVFLLLKQFLLRFKAVLIDCLRAPTRRFTAHFSRRAFQPRRSTTLAAHHWLQLSPPHDDCILSPSLLVVWPLHSPTTPFSTS